MPWENLAAMLFAYTKDENGSQGGDGFEPLASWNHHAILELWGRKNLLSVPSGATPPAVMRSDPDETTYYFQQFVKKHTPRAWEGLKADNPQGLWEPVTEVIGRQAGVSRGQADQQAVQVKPNSDPLLGKSQLPALRPCRRRSSSSPARPGRRSSTCHPRSSSTCPSSTRTAIGYRRHPSRSARPPRPGRGAPRCVRAPGAPRVSVHLDRPSVRTRVRASRSKRRKPWRRTSATWRPPVRTLPRGRRRPPAARTGP